MKNILRLIIGLMIFNYQAKAQDTYETYLHLFTNSYAMPYMEFPYKDVIDLNENGGGVILDLGGNYVQFKTEDTISPVLFTQDREKIQLLVSHFNDNDRDLAVIALLYAVFDRRMPNQSINIKVKGEIQYYDPNNPNDPNWPSEIILNNWRNPTRQALVGRSKQALVDDLTNYLSSEGYLD